MINLKLNSFSVCIIYERHIIEHDWLSDLLHSNVYSWYKNRFISIYLHFYCKIALDERIFLGVFHLLMKNIKSRDLEATPMGGATSKPVPASDVVCLLLLV